ncbi:MAG: pilin [Gammaproteobacteria bacterium]|nr:pilin [Gammaproteobacteria bacterium]MDH4315800.1 pilin [Gammaproteobacteria bacterium]MDH5214478.1 pilin [Gammaproteobacteria bacterium]
MVFENNPAEALFSGSAGTIVALGVVAAIAIPAYQDYTIRAHVTEGYNLASQVQFAVEEYHSQGGEFPPPSIAAKIGNDVSGKYTKSVSVMAGTGVIVVTFFDDAVPDGGQLFFEPYVLDGEISEWICSGTLDPKLMPEACRYNEVPEEVHGGA